jgi:hypothetical protein
MKKLQIRRTRIFLYSLIIAFKVIDMSRQKILYVVLILLLFPLGLSAQPLWGRSPIYTFNIVKGSAPTSTNTPIRTTTYASRENLDIKVVDAAFTSDTKPFRKGVPITLELSVQNKSKAAIESLSAELELPLYVHSIDKGSFSLQHIATNQKVDIPLSFIISMNYSRTEVPITIHFWNKQGFSYRETKILSLNNQQTVDGAFSTIRRGKDRAVFFAVEKYATFARGRLPNLNNPINDAEKMAKVLRENYGFETQVVKNPKKKVITDILREYDEKYKTNQYDSLGQLFIFFSGHGIKKSGNGYFLPADADPNSYDCINCIPYNVYKGILSNLSCKHILVAIDACFSGTFDEALWKSDEGRWKRKNETSALAKFYERHNQKRARFFLTSGDNKTPDKSVFVKSMLEGLETMDRQNGFITAGELYESFISQNAFTSARFGKFGDDEAGSSFLFFTNKR